MLQIANNLLWSIVTYHLKFRIGYLIIHYLMAVEFLETDEFVLGVKDARIFFIS